MRQYNYVLSYLNSTVINFIWHFKNLLLPVVKLSISKETTLQGDLL